jgi:hypothetical protein
MPWACVGEVVESGDVRRLSEVFHFDHGVRVDVLHALRELGPELLDQR